MMRCSHGMQKESDEEGLSLCGQERKEDDDDQTPFCRKYGNEKRVERG